jgi:hypothetical protein
VVLLHELGVQLLEYKPGLRIRILIQHFRLNTDPDPRF